jgi:hypothetical protein
VNPDPIQLPQVAPQVIPRQWWEYGVLAIICVAFAYVIIFLYKRGERVRDLSEGKAETTSTKIETERRAMEGERAEWALEREKWAIEREKIRADMAEKFARDLRDVYEQSRANEATLRREYADMIETMAAESKRASDALVAMLSKLHDRALFSKTR